MKATCLQCHATDLVQMLATITITITTCLTKYMLTRTASWTGR
jgi:hypothetical protein